MDKTGCSASTVGAYRASNYTNSSQSWKPQHNPAKLSVDHRFTLNHAVFHPQGTYPYGTLRLKVQLKVSVEAIQCTYQHNTVALK